MKHFLRTLSLLLLCVLLAFSAVAAEPGDHGYYDANGDGKVEIIDVLLHLRTLLNADDPDYNLMRVLRVLRTTTTSEAVCAEIVEIDTDTMTAVFTVDGFTSEYALPLAALGLDGTVNAALYAGASFTLTVPEPADDFFANYDVAKVFAAAVDVSTLETFTVKTRISGIFTDKQTGKLYVYTDLLENEIPAETLGITADMPKSSYLGLTVTLKTTCDESSFAEAYANGKASILSCTLPQYTTVVNTDGDVTAEWMWNESTQEDLRVLNVGGAIFALADYNVVCYELGDLGWMESDDWFIDAYEIDAETGKYNVPETALSALSYRTEAQEDGRMRLELLYVPVRLAQYRTRTLTNATNGKSYVYTVLGEYMGWEETDLDGKPNWFIERFLDGMRLSDCVQNGEVQNNFGALSRNVALRGEETENGDLVYCSYYIADRALTVHENLGKVQYGKLNGMVFTDKALTIGDKSYLYAKNALSSFDYYSVMDTLGVRAEGNDIQYVLRDGELLFAESYTDPASVPTYDFAIFTLDGAIVADLLGITPDAYWNALVDYRFFIEDGMVVAAFLNTETGEWEKGYVDTVVVGSADSTYDLAECALYSALGTLTGEAQAYYNSARTLLEKPLALVIAEENGVYTLADRDLLSETDFLLPRGEAANGIQFTEGGLTTPISASKYDTATAIQTNENTLLVAVDNYSIGIRRGVQDERSSLYGRAEIFAASEDLIVFYTSDDAYWWAEIPVKNGNERYYTVTADSEFTIERTDDVYLLTLTEVFDHTAMQRTDLVCTATEKNAYPLYDTLAYAMAGTILYGSDSYGYTYAEANYNGVLSETFDSVWTAPENVTFATDGKMTVTVENDEDAAGEKMTLPVSSAVVLTFDHITYDEDAYDFSALDSVQCAEVSTLTAATAGVFDATVLNTYFAWAENGTAISLPAKSEDTKDGEVILDLFLSSAYNAETETATLYVIKVLSGGDYVDKEPVDFPKEENDITLPDVTYAIVSTDPETVASFYGKTERELKRSLINGYLIESDMLVAAFLNTETGAWEKGYIESVSLYFDTYSGFFETVDLAKLLRYSAILTLGANAQTQLDNACALLQSGIVTVASEKDGVYALASVNASYERFVEEGTGSEDAAGGYWEQFFLIDRYEMMPDATGTDTALLGFTDGVTTPIKATADKSVEATPLTLTEDTVIVLINEPMQQTVVFRGIPTKAQNLYGAMATVFAASEDLIVLSTDADVSAWCEPVAEQYYTLLGTSEWELKRNDNNSYTVTLLHVFDHTKNALGSVSVTLAKYDEVKALLSSLDNAAQGTVYVYDPEEEWLGETSFTQENLLIFTDPDFTLVPIADAVLTDCTAEVITINATAPDAEEYDLTALRYTDNAGNVTDLALSLDTFKVITAPTAGVLDALTVSMNGVPLTAPLGTDYANGTEVKMTLFAAEYTDKESGARTLRVVKLLTGDEVEREETEIPAPVYPAAPDYGFAVLTVNQDVVQPLLGLTWDEYAAANVDGYYVEDGKVVCAVLNTATGEFEKGYIDSVALYYDYTTASFNTYVALAELARLASIIPLNPDLAADYENARMILERGIVLAVEQTDNVYTVADVYTAKGNAAGDTAATAASFFADRWYDPEMRGLVFDEAGMTNAIKATESATAAPVQTNEDTVVAIVWTGGMAVRRGVQTEENSLYGIDTTYFAANEDLILVYTNMAQWDWDEVEDEPEYFLPLPETSVELERNDDGSYTFTIENVISLKTLETITLTHVTNKDGVYDLLYMLDIEIEGLFCRRGDKLTLENMENITINDALRASTGLPDAYVYSFVDADTMELELEVAEDEYATFGKDNPLSGITVTVAFADRTGTDFSLYDTETMYADDTNVVEGLYEDLDTVTVDGDTYYVYTLPEEGAVTITEPTPGVFSELEILASNRPLRAKNQKGNYEKLGVIRMFSVGTYDADTNTADILLLYTLKPIA